MRSIVDWGWWVHVDVEWIDVDAHLDACLGQRDLLGETLAREHVRVVRALELCTHTPTHKCTSSRAHEQYSRCPVH